MVLSEKYQLIQKLAKDFTEAEIPSELQDEIDQTGEFPQDLLKKFAQYGFYGIIDQTGAFVLPAEYYDINSVEDAGDYCGGINDGFYYIWDGWKSGSKCGFAHVFVFHSNLVITGMKINFREVIRSLQLIEQIIYPWKMISIPNSNLVQFSIVDTESL